jgi:hypothetical protein
MARKRDSFREFGILPHKVRPPEAEIVRCYLRWYHVLVLYTGVCMLLGLGIGSALIVLWNLPSPWDVFLAPIPLAGFGYFIYLRTRQHQLWVELDGETLRARHLFTGRKIERTVDEIEDLVTVAFVELSATAALMRAWHGRILGIKIRFHDNRSPIFVSRANPAMKNARQLVEAVVYRMSTLGKVHAEIVDLQGEPLVRRICWT